MFRALMQSSAVLLALAGSVAHAQPAGRLDSIQPAVVGNQATYTVTGSGWVANSTVRVKFWCPAVQAGEDMLTTATPDGRVQATLSTPRPPHPVLIGIWAATREGYRSNRFEILSP
jgi:hypothetical protein